MEANSLKRKYDNNFLINISRKLLLSVLFSLIAMTIFTSQYKQSMVTWSSEPLDQILARRLDLLNQTCRKYNGLDQFEYEWSWISIVPYTTLHPSGKYNVCYNFKVGTESWISLSKELSKQKIPPPTRDISLLTVRHPFSRLVSAYRDKFLNGLPFSTYHKRNTHEQTWDGRWSAWWLLALITNRRISAPPLYLTLINDLQKKLRKQMEIGENIAFGQPVINLQQALVKSFGNKNIKSLANEHRNSSISFQEFINHVLWSYEFSVVDPHWVSFSALCDVCETEYDYIIKLENATDEVPYVLSKMGYNVNSFENTHNSKTKDKSYSYLEYFNGLSRNKLDKLYHIYKYDFLLFGYYGDI